ncbi:MAG: hypothetical protein AAF449_12480 [Myxococcota bacterium]
MLAEVNQLVVRAIPTHDAVGDPAWIVNGATLSDQQFNALFTVLPEDDDGTE